MSKSPIAASFAEVVRVVADSLSSEGFTRRGSLFVIENQGNRGVVEFQKSAANSPQELRFTINIGVIVGALVDPGASGQTSTMDAHVRQRIGGLLPGRPDMWWKIGVETDADALGEELATTISRVAVPFVKRYLSTTEVVRLWEAGTSPGLTAGQRARFLERLRTSLR